MSKIVIVGGIKGGGGKTTVATNLTVSLVKAGFNVLLIDADDQETATDFTTLRNERTDNQAGYTAIQLRGKAVQTEGKRLSANFDYVVIDVGGRDTVSQRAALTIANICLIPFVPRSFDVWTLDKMTLLVEEAQTFNTDLKAFAFINRADSQGSYNEDASGLLKDNEAIDFIDTPLGQRKTFAHAATEAKGIVELAPKDKKAVAEFTKLYDYVTSI